MDDDDTEYDPEVSPRTCVCVCVCVCVKGKVRD